MPKAQPTTKELIAMLYGRLPELFERPQSKPWVGLEPEDFDGVIKSDAFEAGAYWANNKLREKNSD